MLWIKGLRCQSLGESIESQHVVDRHWSQLNQVYVDAGSLEWLESAEDGFLLHRKKTDFAFQCIAVFDVASSHLLEVPNHVVQIKRNLLLGFIANDVRDLLDFDWWWLEELRQT